MIKFLLFSVSIIFCNSLSAQWNSNISGGYRTVPHGMNILATVAYDRLLWGEYSKEKPLYGYTRAGLKAGGAPTAAVFAQIAPVAPLVIEVQRSATYRYTESQIFDCKTYFCYGLSERSEVSARLAAGYRDLVGFASYLWRDITLPESSNPVVSEIEYVTASPGAHHYREFSVAAGILSGKNFAGVIYSAGEFSENGKRASSAYAVYKWSYQEFDLTAGAGRYISDENNVGGDGLLLAISKSFGNSLSLF